VSDRDTQDPAGLPADPARWKTLAPCRFGKVPLYAARYGMFANIVWFWLVDRILPEKISNLLNMFEEFMLTESALNSSLCL
jgi:hypothetical protein